MCACPSLPTLFVTFSFQNLIFLVRIYHLLEIKGLQSLPEEIVFLTLE